MQSLYEGQAQAVRGLKVAAGLLVKAMRMAIEAVRMTLETMRILLKAVRVHVDSNRGPERVTLRLQSA